MAGLEILGARGQENIKSTVGRHLIAELFDCDKQILTNVNKIREIFIKAAKEAKMHVVTAHFHRFNPHGVSGMVIVAESHLSIHTWPEHGYAAVDIYVCGDDADPWNAYKVIVTELKARQVTALELKRGIIIK
ncbi:MAG: adenosylmethionine decarboxylase [Thermoprotei archaeon]|jgi:S-adenosylmethionine decarboxylase proenzyme